MFDSSVTRGTPFKFTIGQGQVISAWDKGFATMRKGEKGLLTCGPTHAYGAAGSPPKIPANATLVFEVELLGFGPKPKQDWELTEAERLELGEAAKNEGNAAFAAGDLVGAAEAYERAWKKVSSLGSPETAALRCAIKLNSAACALKAKDFRRAAAEADTAVLINSASAKAHFRLGCARAELGDFAAAKKALVRAAQLAPGDAACRAEYERVKALHEKSKAASAGAFKGILTRGGGLGVASGEAVAASAKPSAGGFGGGAEDSEEEEEEGKGEGGAEAAPAAAGGAGGAGGEEKLDD